MSLPTLRSALRLGLIATCLAAAGCGDDGPSDEEQIATAVKGAATSGNVKANCETTITARFLREVYGGLRGCREANKPDPDDDRVEKASNSETRIKEDRATTRLKVSLDGEVIADGRVALVKEGEDWKLDRFGLDWLRSVFVGLPKIEGIPKGSAACLQRATRGLSPSALRKNANALTGSRVEDASPVIQQCLVGKTIGREQFEKGIEEGLKEEGLFTKARFECIKRRMLSAISDEEIARVDGENLPPGLERKLTRIVQLC